MENPIKSTRNNLKSIPAKFHTDPIWNDGALYMYEDCCPNNNNISEMSSDRPMGSVPDPKMR